MSICQWLKATEKHAPYYGMKNAGVNMSYLPETLNIKVANILFAFTFSSTHQVLSIGSHMGSQLRHIRGDPKAALREIHRPCMVFEYRNLCLSITNVTGYMKTHYMGSMRN